MKAAISKLNQSGLHLDDEAVRTIQAASRTDWNPSEQLVLVTIPDLSQPTSVSPAGMRGGPALVAGPQLVRPHWGAIETAQASLNEAVPTHVPAAKHPAPPIANTGPDVSGQVDTFRAASVARSTSAANEEIASPQKSGESAGSRMASASRAVAAEPTVGHAAVVEAIVARFNATSSFLIHFCDIDQPRRSAEVCLSVGFELAERMQRRILLLDSSRTNRPLSGLLGVDLAAGFREVVRTDLNWRNLIRSTSHPLVEVLPAGVIKLASSRGPEQELAVRKLVAELSQRYGGICSCADSAYDPETELLGRCSSGAFLTIDFQLTSRGLARAAARQMQLTGNRLLGCIAAALPG